MASFSSNVVGVHYQVWKKIGEGSFGVVFRGTDLLNNQEVAIKFVRQQPPHNQYMGTRRYAGSEIAYPIVRLYTHTSIVYRNLERVMLHNCETSIEHINFWSAAVSMPKLAHEGSSTDIQIAGIPNVYHFGQEGLHNILVIDLLGPSLEDLFDTCNRRFSTKTVVVVGKQMVQFATVSSQYFMLTIPSSGEFKQSTKRTSSTVTSSLTTSSLVDLDPKLPMSSMWWILAWASNIGIPKRSNISHIVSENHFLALQDI